MSSELYPDELAIGLQPKVIDESRQGEALKYEKASKRLNTNGKQKKFYIESYGCQMNFADSEIVASILTESGFDSTTEFREADLILINTCAIRDNAEQRVRNRLHNLQVVKKKNKGALIGVLGCMAERLKEKFLEEEKIVDIVAGPDSYRSLPGLIEEAGTGQKAVNVLLSREETYAEISPLRLNSNGVCAFISIMRGCDNMCSFCVVPFTRGRERSRDWQSILTEAKDLYEKGYREVTLLGQNVDSYKFADADGVVSFANLLEKVAQIAPDLRLRFSTSHPKDITDEVLHIMAKYTNVCKYIHLPIQSGNSRVLKLMNRTYDREWYLQRVEAIQRIVPEAAISTDVITGFCSETEEEHQDTVSLLQQVRFSMAYMFFYSERPGTLAARNYKDDIPEEVKKRRLQEIVDLQMNLSHEHNKLDIGAVFEVLVEGTSHRSDKHLFGRNTQNKVIVFPKRDYAPGMYVNVKVTGCTAATLIGEAVN